MVAKLDASGFGIVLAEAAWGGYGCVFGVEFNLYMVRSGIS